MLNEIEQLTGLSLRYGCMRIWYEGMSDIETASQLNQ